MVKTLAQEELNMVSYIKRDKEKLEFENPHLKPVSFIITQFHIIFVYHQNLTVLSSITMEIVYSKNFEDSFQIKNSIYDLY